MDEDREKVADMSEKIRRGEYRVEPVAVAMQSCDSCGHWRRHGPSTSRRGTVPQRLMRSSD
jgi:hypothetical protein